nr:hypothetical protein [Tanacetum cinerariifolium]
MELELEQSQQGSSHEVSVSTEGVEELKRIVRIKGVKKEALHTTLGSDDGVTTSLQPSRNSRPIMLDHQDKYMMKAQVHVSKSFAISDVQPLPRRKHYCQIYQVVKHMLRGRLLASFQDHEHKGGDKRSKVGERVIEGPEIIEVTNAKVAVAKEKHKEARTRQKSYADKHRRALEFQTGDHVFLKVSPTRGVRRFGIKAKLSPRFIGPFEILDRVGEVSYRLALPPQLSHVHDVFHVSLLRGYKYHPLHVITCPLDQIRTDLSYVEEPEAILDRQDEIMRKKTIPFVKILWRNHPEREATWETEESIWTSYPHFLP